VRPAREIALERQAAEEAREAELWGDDREAVRFLRSRGWMITRAGDGVSLEGRVCSFAQLRSIARRGVARALTAERAAEAAGSQGPAAGKFQCPIGVLPGR
jgi:hypothetical protein